MRPRFASLFALAACSCAAQEALPITSAETLSGHKVEFPTVAAGKTAVCVFGFTKEAGDRTKVWMDHLSHDGINAWSIANLERAPAFVRGMIRGSMRKGTAPALLDHSLVMTKDEQEWRRALDVKQENLPVVVLLDAQGHARWTHEALFSDEAYQELKKRLDALSSAP